MIRTGTDLLTATEHLNGLSSKEWTDGLTPREAFGFGLSLSLALSIDRPKTKLILYAHLKRLWRNVRVGADKTWTSDEDLYDAVDDITEEFKTMKVEEIILVFKEIRLGKRKIYGRLDTPFLFEQLRDYDINQTTTFREAQHPKTIRGERESGTATFAEALHKAGVLGKDGLVQSLPKKTLTYCEALERGSVLTPEQRAELRQKDKERNSIIDIERD